MDPNITTLIIAGFIQLPTLIWMIIRDRREQKRKKEQAPLEDSRDAVTTSASAAEALKSYSDEVLKLRQEINSLRVEVDKIKRESEQKDRRIETLIFGIRRLIAQLVSLNATPVWQPDTDTPG